jgi:Fe-S-cluster containining protein
MPSTTLSIYSKSIIKLQVDGKEKSIEFMYPVGIKWSCTRCGSCCQDIENHERHILLIQRDLNRFRNGSYDINDITESSNNDKPFENEMKKIKGKCILLTEIGCKAYEYRALLCRMYPFWIEKKDNLFIIRFDTDCIGLGSGVHLKEKFYQDLITFAINERGGLNNN